MKFLVSTILVLLVSGAASAAQSAGGSTDPLWYIADTDATPVGDDANDCTEAAPCLTLAGVFGHPDWSAAKAAEAQTIYLDAGTEYNYNVAGVPDNSGDEGWNDAWTTIHTTGTAHYNVGAGSPSYTPSFAIVGQDCPFGCTLRSSGDIDTAVTPSATVSNQVHGLVGDPPAAHGAIMGKAAGLWITDSDDWTVAGIHFDSHAFGFYGRDSNNLVIKNNRFTCDWGSWSAYPSGAGATCFHMAAGTSTNTLIEGNEIHKDGNRCSSNWGRMCISNNSDRYLHEFSICNTEADCGAQGVDAEYQYDCGVVPTGGIFDIATGNDRVTIRGNYIHHGSNFGSMSAEQATIENNVFGVHGEHGWVVDTAEVPERTGIGYSNRLLYRNNVFGGDPQCACVTNDPSGDALFCAIDRDLPCTDDTDCPDPGDTCYDTEIEAGDCNARGTDYIAGTGTQAYYSDRVGANGLAMADMTWAECTAAVNVWNETWRSREYCDVTWERADDDPNCTGAGTYCCEAGDGDKVYAGYPTSGMMAWKRCSRQPRGLEIGTIHDSMIVNNSFIGQHHPTKGLGGGIAFGIYFETQDTADPGEDYGDNDPEFLFERLLIQNNLFYDYGARQSDGTGFIRLPFDSATFTATDVDDIRLDNNLYHEGNGQASWSCTSGINNHNDTAKCEDGTTPCIEDADCTGIGDGNCLNSQFAHTLANWQTAQCHDGITYDANSTYAEPAFVGYATMDYRVEADTSAQEGIASSATVSDLIPCTESDDCPGWNVDTQATEFTCGVTAAGFCDLELCPPEDFLGQARPGPTGDGCDMGAFEYYSLAGSPASVVQMLSGGSVSGGSVK